MSKAKKRVRKNVSAQGDIGRKVEKSAEKDVGRTAQKVTQKNVQRTIQKAARRTARKTAQKYTRATQKSVQRTDSQITNGTARKDIRKDTRRMPETTPGVDRTYKARLFAMIFSEKENLLELYNAVNGTHYDDTELLEVNTLENAIYMSMRNDLSFVIDSRLSLYEHQSTSNPNLPLRFLFYIADLYSGMLRGADLYGRKRIPLDTPHFLIFYNGLGDAGALKE